MDLPAEGQQPSLKTHFEYFTAEALVVRKNPFSRNQRLQVFDFIEAKIAILMVFEFFLMTAERTETLAFRSSS